MSANFTFGHLSDIHFAGYQVGATFDVNADIRRELVHDLDHIVETSGSLDSFLIGGDVAGRGGEDEYELAGQWISELCDRFGVPLDMVFCVPGNHDVDQSVIRSDSVLLTIQKALRDCLLEDFDPLLEQLVTNGEHCGLLLSGLDNYNEFAFQYGCAFGLDQHKWEHPIPFGDLTINIVGLTSALISGPLDSRTAEGSKLAIGPQGRIGRFRDTLTILLCHHPPSWFRDREVLNPFLERSHLQLYGHEHSFSMKPSGAGFRIDAGAVHPARSEKPWKPSYNVISLHNEEDGAGEATIDVYARTLKDDHTFGSLDPDEEMRREKVNIEIKQPAGLPPEMIAAAPELEPVNERDMARRFVALSVERRLKIGKDLELLSRDDETLPQGARMRRIFEVARERGELDELSGAIDG